MTRTRREIKRDLRRARLDVKRASVGDDAERFITLRRLYDALKEELTGLDTPHLERLALLPGEGTFTMRSTLPPTAAGRRGEAEEEKQSRLLRNFNAQRTGLGTRMYDPERDAARAARVRSGKEHVSALLRDRFSPWRAR